jgi:uncharacterized protein
MAHPRFRIFPSPAAEFSFDLTAPNGAIILASQRYSSHSGAVSGIASVKANAALEERYVRRLSQRDEPYFVLKGANGEVIGTSEMYSSPSARDAGMRSVMDNAPKAPVEG